MVFHKILKEKRKQIAKTKKLAPLESLKKQLSSRSQRKKHAFAKALSAKNRLHLICELKKASPSAGLLKRDFIPTHLAREFQKAGASAISVLTEEHYFEGRLSTIREIRSVTHLPILRKDFIIEPYQIYETAAAGADAFLLITSLLKKSKLSSMIRLGYSLGLDALVEVHTRKELGIALKSGARIIGLNNRNLKTLKVNIPSEIYEILSKLFIK